MAAMTLFPGDQNLATIAPNGNEAALIIPNIKAYRAIDSGIVI
ncbi:MAG: hypothetical protein P8J61_04965 [Gammaproteobacteria bacterium]|jgi:hypothetical protein|nr:hypothetical protein [Gammaproteobacteria bacterium]